MSNTPRLGLPFLTPGQAQKEFFHNEALQTLDTLVEAVVEVPSRDSPPPSPTLGECHIIGPAGDGEWSGRAGQIAAYSAGGWRFHAPVEGMVLFVRSSGLDARFRSGVWEYGVIRTGSVMVGGAQVVSTREPAIASPSGGTTADSEARMAIDEILSALRHHGLIEV